MKPLPCPFCQNTLLTISYCEEPSCSCNNSPVCVECFCGCELYYNHSNWLTPEDAINAWNNRTTPLLPSLSQN